MKSKDRIKWMIRTQMSTVNDQKESDSRKAEATNFLMMLNWALDSNVTDEDIANKTIELETLRDLPNDETNVEKRNNLYGSFNNKLWMLLWLSRDDGYHQRRQAEKETLSIEEWNEKYPTLW